MKKSSYDFEAVRKELAEKGYSEKEVIIGPVRANVQGFLFGVPFFVLFSLVYRLFFTENAHIMETEGMGFLLVLAVVMFAVIAVHEALHGIGWAMASGKGFDKVWFGVSSLMPVCAYHAVMSKKQYLTGVLLPFIALGTASVLFMMIYPGTLAEIIMLIAFVGAGGDLLIAFSLRKEPKDAIIADHPSKPGYYAYTRDLGLDKD